MARDKNAVIRNQHASLIRLIRERNYHTLIDLGCGNAEKALFFAQELGMKVTAMDEFEGHGSDARLEDIGKKVNSLGLSERVSVIKLDALQIEQLGQTFDVVFIQNVLHHIFPWPESKNSERIKSFFNELRKILSQRGLIYITDAGRWNFWDRLHRVIPGKWYQAKLFSSINQVDFNTKTPASVWQVYLKEAGFHKLFLEYYVPYEFRRLKWALNNPLANVFIESIYSIAAESSVR
jgi:cyclopropane fatty-acyl-phospholipid synthase-like methyltransferase